MKTPLRAFEAARSRRQADSPRTAFQPGLQPGRRHHPPERRPHRHAARRRRCGTAARTDPPAGPAGSARLPDAAGIPFRAGRRALRAHELAEPRHRRRLHRRARACTRSAAWSASRPSTTTSTSARSASPAEFLWHDSVEAAEFRRLRRTTEPVCWTQLGYASGYASEFFDTLIIYKEVECAAQGHRHCRVVGKPADVWGPGDPEVILFRERIAAPQEGGLSEPLRKVAARTAESALSELDRLILAPVRAELDRLAPMALPVMITGSPGTGRSRAARYLHRACGHVRNRAAPCVRRPGRPRPLRRDRAARQGRASRRCRRDDPDRRRRADPRRSPAASRPRDRGGDAGRRAACPGAGGLRSVRRPARAAALSSELWYALSALTVRMPTTRRARGPASWPSHRR